MNASTQWFDVDKDGLRLLLGPRGKPGVMIELVSNALDENVERVDIRLTPIGRGKFTFEVEDDSPDGFKDLTHAYTLFAPSSKKGDSTKRGRFNFGEKLVLAFCTSARISTTTGSVYFSPKGRSQRNEVNREKGTVFTAELELTRTEAEEFRLLLNRILLAPIAGPAPLDSGVLYRQPPVVTYNGVELSLVREPVLTFKAYWLPTPTQDDRGVMHISHRDCDVQLYKVLPGEAGYIYELGIPVVEHAAGGCGYHVNVLQKVPLTMDRDNVSEAFRRQIMALTLNALGLNGMVASEAKAPWVTEAMSSAWVSDEVVRTIARERFGEKSVIFDPSDPESNKIAMSKGFNVVHGGSFPSEAWTAIKRAEAILPAGRVTPSPRLNASSQGVEPIPEEDWTEEMRDVVKQCQSVAAAILPQLSGVYATIYPHLAGTGAAYGRGGSLSLNWEHVGPLTRTQLNALLLHEYAHESQSDHFDHAFLDEVCRLGSQLAIAASTYTVRVQ